MALGTLGVTHPGPPRCGGGDVSGLVWARPEALVLLLLLPVILLSGLIFGAGKRGFRRNAIAWRLVVAALLIVGLAEPMLASSTGAGGVVFAIDRSSSVDLAAQDAAERWLNDALAAAQIVNMLEALFLVGSIGLMAETTELVGQEVGRGEGCGEEAWVRRIKKDGKGKGMGFGVL